MSDIRLITFWICAAIALITLLACKAFAWPYIVAFIPLGIWALLAGLVTLIAKDWAE